MKIGSRTTAEFNRAVIQKEGTGYRFERVGTLDKTKFGGRFKRTINIKGFVSDTGQIGYTTETPFKMKFLKKTFNFNAKTSGFLTPTKTGLKGYELINGKRISVKYDAKVTMQQGARKPILTEGEQRLALVRTGLKLTGQKFIEKVEVRGVKTRTGDLLLKQTPIKRDYVSLVGEVKGLTAPLHTKETTVIGKEVVKFKGSMLQRSLLTALKSPILVGGTLQGTSTGTGFKQIIKPPKSTFKGSEYLIEPTYTPTEFKPFVSIGQTPETKYPESKFSTKIQPKERLKQLQKPLVELESKREEILIEESIFEKSKSSSRSITIPKDKQELIQPQETTPKEKTIQELIQPQDLKQEEKLIIDPIEPPPPPPPIILVPPIMFGLTKRKPLKQLRRKPLRQPRRFRPSLVGIVSGIKATRTTNLSGLEIRGIETPKKKKKRFNFGKNTLTPTKIGIGMRFKITRPKKTKSKETIKDNFLRRIKTTRAV